MFCSRVLDTPSFAGVNNLLSKIQIKVAQAYDTSGTYAYFISYKLQVKNLLCVNIQIGSISLSTTIDNTKNIATSPVAVTGLSISCSFELSYQTTADNGDHTISAPVTGASVSFPIVFSSPNLSTAPINSVTIPTCSASLSINPVLTDGNSLYVFQLLRY